MRAEKSDLQIETIVSRIRDKQLDLQPDFQRGEIWDKKRRTRLIDTVLRSWFIPAVHIVVDEDQNEVVLDGQQRLVAIRDFIDGEFAVDGTLEPDDKDIASLDGMYFRDLPEARQRAFLRFSLPVVTLSDFEPQEPNELFFRLNQSYNLTPSEKRNALHGPARDQVRQLVENLTDLGLLTKDVIGFSNSRLAYDDIVARVCVALEKGTLREHINNATVENYYRGRAFSPKTLDSVIESAAQLIKLIGADTAKFNKGTLQTWLIYCCWAPITTGSIPIDLLSSFESNRLALRRGAPVRLGDGAFVQDVLRMYDDRASYRVTDVSSVVIRDFGIHYYSQEVFGTRPRKSSESVLRHIPALPESSPQVLVNEYLEDVEWGAPIAERISE